jgi:ferredoxin-NADP reductase
LTVQWLVGTIIENVHETPKAVSLRLNVDGWPGHRPGQHVDVRLTAQDGYSAQRSYSIASPPSVDYLELTVVRIDQGEVSPYLTTVVEVGDKFELRGPIGGYFVWAGAEARPVLLLGGGSGVVPLMSMLRHHAASGTEVPMHLLYSARTRDDILYRDELARLATGRRRAVTITLTREAPAGWAGQLGRVGPELLSTAGWPPEDGPLCFVCGPTPFVEVVADALVKLGHGASNIRTERFGPTGGG